MIVDYAVLQFLYIVEIYLLIFVEKQAIFHDGNWQVLQVGITSWLTLSSQDSDVCCSFFEDTVLLAVPCLANWWVCLHCLHFLLTFFLVPLLLSFLKISNI